MRLIAWLGKMIVVICLVCGVSIFTTWQVVNLYVKKLLEPFQLEQQGLQPDFPEFLAHWYSALLPETAKDRGHDAQPIKPGPTSEESQLNHETAQEAGQEEDMSNEGSRTPAESVGEEHGEEEAVPVWSNQGGRLNQAGSGQVMITEEQFNETRDKISNADKMKILNLVFQKIPQKEMQDISTMMEDGLTAEELAQIEKVIEKYLNEEEMEELLAIMQKY